MALSTIMPAAAEYMIRFGTALSLTANLVTEDKLVREGYVFSVKAVSERGGIDVAVSNLKHDRGLATVCAGTG